jgi:hypothetical protein
MYILEYFILMLCKYLVTAINSSNLTGFIMFTDLKLLSLVLILEIILYLVGMFWPQYFLRNIQMGPIS